MTDPERVRQHRRRALRALGFALYVFVCCEILVRVISHFVQLYDIEMLRYALELKVRSTLPGISHEHRVQRSATLMGVEIRLNSLGHRSPELARPKPAGERRLTFLGSSITLGWGVPESQAFPALAVARLNQARERAGAPVCVAVNAGIGNYNTVNEVDLFARQRELIEPDLVILQYYLNDAEIKSGGADSPLLTHSLFLAYLLQRAKVAASLRRASLADYYLGLYSPDAAGWQQAFAALGRLAALCREHRLPLVAVLVPEVHDLRADGPYQPLYRLVSQTMAGLGIPVIDATPALQTAFAAAPEQAWVARDDPHPSAAAHAVIARTLADAVLADSSYWGASGGRREPSR